MTKREMWAKVLTFKEVQANPEIVEGIEHEIELIERKNSAPKKPTANQEDNEKIMLAMVAEMKANPNRLYTATELGKILEPVVKITPLSNQRISALLRKLGDNGSKEIVSVKQGRKSLFKIAEG